MGYFKFEHRKIKEMLSYYLMRLQRSDRNQTKIFCVGRNKTGTTSIASFFRQNGYKIGNQETAELLINDWHKRDFSQIIEYVKTAEIFQDIPFSLPYTFEALDYAFPNSKFILTVRSTSEEWYNSIITFHAKITSSHSKTPTEDDLLQFKYRRKYLGWLLEMQKLVYNYPTTPLYDQKLYIEHYEQHNASVIKYFKDRPNDLLVLNLNDKDSFKKLCRYIGLDSSQAVPIPHLNKSTS